MIRREQKLSDSEWILMKLCWKKDVSSAKDVHEIYKIKSKVTYVTTKTMLDRLVEKEFLKREKFGPIWLYSTTMPEKKMIEMAIEKFVDNILDGNMELLINLLNEKKGKYSGELKKIKQLLKD